MGLMAGAFVIGPFADRHGRKAVLMFTVLFFGTASLVSAYSPNLRLTQSKSEQNVLCLPRTVVPFRAPDFQ